MKKMVFTLALLLMSLSAVMAQTWTFGAMSEADKALCSADANWVLGTDRYCYTLALENEALVANGSELAYAKGLKFTAGAPATKTEGKAKVRLNYGNSRLELNGNGVSLTIPSLKAGQKVTVSCKTGSTSTARCLDATNLTSVSGSFGTPTKEQVTNVGTVTADGDVVLKTNGEMSAGDIASEFDLSNATISYHLSLLKKADLIFENRQQKYIYYKINVSVFEDIVLWCMQFNEGAGKNDE